MQTSIYGKALFLRWQDKFTLWNNLPGTVSAHPRQVCRDERIQFSGRRKLLERKDSLDQLVAGELLEYIHGIGERHSLLVQDRGALESSFQRPMRQKFVSAQRVKTILCIGLHPLFGMTF